MSRVAPGSPRLRDEADTSKACIRCGDVYTAKEFKPGRNTCRLCRNEMTRARDARNRAHIAANKREWHANNPHASCFYSLKYNHKMSQAQYEERLESQDFRCAICRSEDTGRKDAKLFCVDHDHECCPNRQRSCGKCVRGLLCHRCNATIGLARENVDILRAAVAYLERATA